MADDWRAALPEDLKAEAMFKDIPDVPTLAKVARDLKAFQGTAIRIPGQDAGPEARKEFLGKLTEKVPELVLVPEDEKARAEVEESIYQRLGKPKDAKEYSLEAVKDALKDLPEGLKLNEEELRATAAGLGLTKKQFAALAKAVGTTTAGAMKAAAEADAALRKEWGSAYDERTAQARAAAAKLGVPEAEVARMPPQLLRVFANAAKAVGGETRQVGGQVGGAGGAMTPAEAAAQRAEIRGRKEFWDTSINAALTETLRKKDLELAELQYGKE